MGTWRLVALDKLVACCTWDVLGKRANHCSRAGPDTRSVLGGKSVQGSRVAQTAQPGVGNHRNLADDSAKREADSGLDCIGSVVPYFLELDLHSALLAVFDFLKKIISFI